MRILLVTWTDQLLARLQNLNPELEYCAIVVDEVEPAKKILEQVGLSKDLLYPLYDLKECIHDFYYDYIICAENTLYTNELLNFAKNYTSKENKLLGFDILNSHWHFLVERALRYYKEHANEFEMIATHLAG